MGVRTAFVSFLVPSAAYSFCPTPQAFCSSIDTGNPNPRFSQGCTSSATAAASSWRQRTPLSEHSSRQRRLVVVAAATGKDAQHGAPTTSGAVVGSKDPRRRVSRALNRALGNVLATGDVFGSVSKSVTDGEMRGIDRYSRLCARACLSQFLLQVLLYLKLNVHYDTQRLLTSQVEPRFTSKPSRA